MKTAADFTPERHALNAALTELDAHWNNAEPTADYGSRLLWLVRQVHHAWVAAGGDDGALCGMTLAGCSPGLTRALFMGGLLSLTTAAVEMMRMAGRFEGSPGGSPHHQPEGAAHE